jgi:NADH:ubiquinone oxidoreductase subunit 6 (subunit J)
MAGLVVLVILAHVGMAAVDLPPLWGRPERRRERWVVILLLVLGLLCALIVFLTDLRLSPFRWIEAIFKPIGTPLFTPREG